MKRMELTVQCGLSDLLESYAWGLWGCLWFFQSGIEMS